MAWRKAAIEVQKKHGWSGWCGWFTASSSGQSSGPAQLQRRMNLAVKVLLGHSKSETFEISLFPIPLENESAWYSKKSEIQTTLNDKSVGLRVGFLRSSFRKLLMRAEDQCCRTSWASRRAQNGRTWGTVKN